MTSGNVYDASVLDALTLDLKGILFGDKGYLSKAKSEALTARELKLLTPVRKMMENVKLKYRKKKTYYQDVV